MLKIWMLSNREDINMKFGIIGFGNIARKFVKSIEFCAEGSVYGIASHSLSLEDEYLLSHPQIKVYDDYEKLLDDDCVEVVYIALPHKYHKEWVLKAIVHHKAVLCEKPLVLNSKDIDDIKTAVLKYQGYCLEAFKTKFNVGMQNLKKDLKLIGKIKTIETNFCFDATKGRKDTYLFDSLQGGALNDVGSYIFGFILDIANSKVDHIEAHMEKQNQIEMQFQAKLYFENGIIGIGEGAINYNKERFALIKGTKGEIYIPVYNRINEYTIIISGEKIQKSFPIAGDDMTMEIQAIIDDVKNGRHENSLHSLTDSKNIQQIIERIREVATK